MTAPSLNSPAAQAATQTEPMHPVAPSLAESLPLRDIHLPEPISWWPLAPGWWIVFASLAFIVALYFIVKKVRYSRRLKRASRQEFEKIKNQYLNDKNENQLLKQLSIFLRRACISFYPRQNTAGLTGESWLNFLDSTLTSANKQEQGINTGFNSDASKILLTAPYLPDDSAKTDINADALLDLCERWLKAQPVKNRLKTFPEEKTTAPTADSDSIHTLGNPSLANPSPTNHSLAASDFKK